MSLYPAENARPFRRATHFALQLMRLMRPESRLEHIAFPRPSCYLLDMDTPS